MEPEKLTTRKTVGIVLAGLLASTAAAVLSALAVQMMRRARSDKQKSRGASSRTGDDPKDTGDASQRTPPIQPAVSAEMPAHLPHHFTEDVILPGFTETGQDVERQDDTEGRSPEGV
ncbi:MAG: hypothetical protein M3Z66_15275 [Chloroflexota bacterium]|nr:hypothetical protein [Chloroflexota bacterium]